MFIGHFAVALAAKKAVPKTSLATLFAAAQFVDLLWPILLLFGLEHVRIDPGNTAMTPLDFYDYPITHSLVGAIGWSVLFGAAYYFRRKLRREAIIVGLLVFSHWILDFVTHRPDLPLVGNDSVKFGMGMWNSFAATVTVESLMFMGGVWLYMRATQPNNKIGTYAFAGLVVFIAFIHIANIFGPTPPNVQMIAIAGNASWLFVVWGWWIDKNRTSKA